MSDQQPNESANWLILLQAPTALERTAALKKLSEAAELPFELLPAVERMAINDRSKEVRAAAQAVLESRAVRQWRAKQPGALSRQLRVWLVGQIGKWQAEELLNEDQAVVLARRYDFDPLPEVGRLPAGQVAPAREPRPRRSLGEILMSEGTIKTALYLGAFFIVMAALIFSALIEILRIPILGGVAGLFLVGSIGLKRSLGQASFVLFALYSLLIPILAGAVLDSLPILTAFSELYWIGVSLFLLANWIAATWFYSSRFFGVLAALVYLGLPIQIGSWLSLPDSVQVNVSLAANVFGLGALWAWPKFKRLPSSRPVWWVLNGANAMLLLSTLFMNPQSESRLWVLWLALAWALATLFYLLAGWLFMKPIATWVGAFASLLVPTYLVAAFSDRPIVFAWGLATWGAVSLFVSAATKSRPTGFAHQLGRASLLTGSLAFWASLFLSLFEPGSGRIWVQVASTVLLLGFAVFQARPVLWVLGLAATFLTYITLALDIVLAAFEPSLGLVLLPLAAGYWALEIGVRKVQSEPRWWSLSPRWFGAVTGGVSALFLLAEMGVAPAEAAWGFGVLAGMLFAYSLVLRFYWGAALAVSLLGLAWWSGILALELETWAGVSVLLPTILGLIWWGLGRISTESPWARPLLVATLGWATVSAALGPLDNGVRSGLLSGGLALLLIYGLMLCAGRRPAAASVPDIVWRIWIAWLGIWLLLITLLAGSQYPQWALAGWLLLAALAGHFAVRVGWVDGVFLACGLLAGALNSALAAAGIGERQLPLVLLAVIYLAAGLWPRLNQERPWGGRLRLAGLILAAGVAFFAWFTSDWPPVFVMAIAALLFTVEAFRRRSALHAIPADLLYMGAYFKLLLVFDITQPQFYSVGAAALGLLMHYLLARSENGVLAFLAGMFSQLVLLGTTYIQMVDTGEIVFFFVLFFQALLVVGYGLVARSRSLVFVPIVALVVGVLTVVFSALSGLFALIVIGCSGFALLFLGILALVLRERLVAAGQLVRDRFGDWSA